MESFVEYEPGKMRADRLTTVKYAVGPRYSSVTVHVDANGNGENEVTFVNAAKSKWESPFVWDWLHLFGREAYEARDFKIEVVDDGGLNLSLGGLHGGDVLSPGEEDRATLRVWGAEPCPSWDSYEVRLKLTYTTVNGEVCSKESLLNIDVD